ncbi:unnamed protein product [Trichogramma brassicae]|uniref:Uncharacterized protein n=1 Tax=Trichogramma brassicae TaxID=86971 RepID=A0A6H5HUU7_9HYME|nr:unnamed protein product [Trichogramma brassicae]
MSLASGLLAVVERLETRGYEMSLSDALKVTELFAKHGMFDDGKSWRCSEEFAGQAKRAMIDPNLSLHDLIQLRPDEAARLLADANPSDLYCLHKKFSEQLQEELAACAVHLCEKISRGFFRSWALDCFWELIGIPTADSLLRKNLRESEERRFISLREAYYSSSVHRQQQQQQHEEEQRERVRQRHEREIYSDNEQRGRLCQRVASVNTHLGHSFSAHTHRLIERKRTAAKTLARSFLHKSYLRLTNSIV